MHNEINSGSLDQASHGYFRDKKISLNKYVNIIFKALFSSR